MSYQCLFVSWRHTDVLFSDFMSYQLFSKFHVIPMFVILVWYFVDLKGFHRDCYFLLILFVIKSAVIPFNPALSVILVFWMDVTYVKEFFQLSQKEISFEQLWRIYIQGVACSSNCDISLWDKYLWWKFFVVFTYYCGYTICCYSPYGWEIDH